MSRQTKANQKLREAGGKQILFKASASTLAAMDAARANGESQQHLIERAINYLAVMTEVKG